MEVHLTPTPGMLETLVCNRGKLVRREARP